jgi:hypothetical protein
VAPGPGVLRWPAQAQAGSLIEAGIFAFVEARRGHWIHMLNPAYQNPDRRGRRAGVTRGYTDNRG